eukprot:7735982-Pyramimonas_sp.AAC.1
MQSSGSSSGSRVQQQLSAPKRLEDQRVVHGWFGADGHPNIDRSTCIYMPRGRYKHRSRDARVER